MRASSLFTVSCLLLHRGQEKFRFFSRKELANVQICLQLLITRTVLSFLPESLLQYVSVLLTIVILPICSARGSICFVFAVITEREESIGDRVCSMTTWAVILFVSQFLIHYLLSDTEVSWFQGIPNFCSCLFSQSKRHTFSILYI